MKVGDLHVTVCDKDGNWVETPITESPYYKSLINMDASIFHKYNKLLKKYSENYPNELDWEGFKDLVLSIAIQGIDNEKMKTVKIESGIVVDGQHRMSALFALYGPNYDISQWVELPE